MPCYKYFYPRPLRRGRPVVQPHIVQCFDFYPRPLRRGRPLPSASTVSHVGFLSTPSSQRATWRILLTAPPLSHFYPRPLRRGRPPRPACTCQARPISIHALFAEGDLAAFFFPAAINISIHALFAEGDAGPACPGRHPVYFYPRPLRRGRPQGG